MLEVAFCFAIAEGANDCKGIHIFTLQSQTPQILLPAWHECAVENVSSLAVCGHTLSDALTIELAPASVFVLACKMSCMRMMYIPT